MTAPFDQPFYDRLMDEPDVRDHATHTDGWMRGYAYCAIVAARIAAERATVSDPFAYLANCARTGLPYFSYDGKTVINELIAEWIEFIGTIPENRAALAPALPVIPEGWRLHSIGEWFHHGPYLAILTQDGTGKEVPGEGDDWHDALIAAIQQVLDNESDS